MAFDHDLIEQILQSVDIVQVISSYIPVSKKGRNFIAICPFHDDKNPSLHISPDKRIFKCFVCGTGGNAITFVEKYEKISYPEAVRKVADMAGIRDERLAKREVKRDHDQSLDPLYRALDDLTSYYNYALTTEEGKEALTYLEKRGLNDRLQADYRLGYALSDGRKTIQYLNAKGHSLRTIEEIGIAQHVGGTYADRNFGRVIFPIMNSNGQPIGFSARRLHHDDNVAKYVNSPETVLFKKAQILFNYHVAKRTARHDGYVYVLEGFMDVFALVKVGITSAVALMGTALTSQHLALLRKLGAEVRLCLDGDRAGQDATMKAIAALDRARLPYRIVYASGDLRDPDEILTESGAEALKDYLNRLVDSATFALQYYRQTNALATLDDRKRLLYNFLPILTSTTSQLDLEDYFLQLQEATRFPIAEIRKLYDEAKRKGQGSVDMVESFRRFHPERKAMRRFQLAEREILYQMTQNAEAVAFYQNEIEYFYDELYRKVANFIVYFYQKYLKLDMSSMLAELGQSDLPDREEIERELRDLSFETTHPSCSSTLLEECGDTIKHERLEHFTLEQLKEAIREKPPLEQAKIVQEYLENQRKKKEQ